MIQTACEVSTTSAHVHITRQELHARPVSVLLYDAQKSKKKARALFLSSSCSKFLKISFDSILVPIHEQIVASSIFYSCNNVQLCRSV